MKVFMERVQGIENIKERMIENIRKAEFSLIVTMPFVIPEVLQMVSQIAYQKQEVNFNLIAKWDLATYNQILKGMSALGNIQIRLVISSPEQLVLIRDKKEL